ncbi:galactoside alpha-(1,2)-fucosyltransferase 1-like isoform X2 [Eriocheir sinensis]|nr:galactoside alpha-(1,2)-fucosyltransferase 1-like isoform X2 [Eriocheir sinensis]
MMFNNPGRLGNRLNSYATSLRFQAVHKGNATVATSRDTVQRLMELLDPTYLPLPVAEKSLVEKAKEKKAFVAVGPNWAKSDFVTHLEPTFQKAEKEFRKNHEPKLYSLGGYPNRMWLLAGHHDTIRAAYRIREDLRQKAARFLEGVRQKRGLQDITFVGFHIRRTDYTKVIKTYYKCSLPGPAYYESALNYYRNKLQNPVFVVASDSSTYARQHLKGHKDVEFSDMKSPAEDMALLGSCSHSIMTVGSYGFWASFFAGGEVVYPLGVNCTVTPFVHPDTLGPRGYENFKPFDMDGGGPL